MPRFVVLEHDHPSLHWDFMLEVGDVLWTWRLAEAPEFGRSIDAERITGHRSIYLDFEGPVRGGRGVVTRWDHGSFEWITDTVDLIAVRLSGSKIRGEATLANQHEMDWIFNLQRG